MKLRIRPSNLLSSRTQSKKRLQTVIDETETETSRSNTFSADDGASIVSFGVQSLPACRHFPTARKSSSREPSLDTGKGLGGLETFFKKYDRNIGSKSSLSIGNDGKPDERDEPRKTKASISSRSTSKMPRVNRHGTAASTSSRRPPTPRRSQRRATGSTKMNFLDKQTKRVQSKKSLVDFFKEYDEITCTGGAASATGW